MNPWHDVDVGSEPDKVFQAVVEIPKGSKNKYELDKETGLLRLDRVLYSAVRYPANYGFLPRTYCEDGDPLDVLLLCQEELVPLCIVTARPIGLLSMTDSDGADDKIVAVPEGDPEYSHCEDVAQLAPHRLLELRQFLLDYKTLEKKRVDVENMRGRDDAAAAIRDAVRLYREKFGKG